MMSPKTIILTLLLTAASLSGWAQGVAAIGKLPVGWLVTPAEAIQFHGEEGFNAPPPLRPRAAVPMIDVVKPETLPDLKVKAPFSIEVHFVPQKDALIDPATFKVLYGAFKFDITERITKYVKVTKAGFNLDNAQIPAGKHRLILQVMDDKQRLAERDLRLEVE